jgi:eukaryotic-like serine/threonine-protein kinase
MVTAAADYVRAALADRYRIERELGQGGMSTVYLAQDLKHRRLVAIKVLRPELGAALGADRFLSEIATTAKLNHPHILALYDSGEASNDGSDRRTFLYYVMPFIEGESLRDRLRRERALGVDEAVRIATQVADALAYAHAHAVIHRDIKPGNILLRPGHAMVADFGIARAVTVAEADRITRSGLSLGTPAYMSPEQSSGEREVDGRSDLYALGCTLYEMLTGEAPFTGPTVDSILVQRFLRPPPRVSARLPHISRHLDAAVFRAMAREPEERFERVELFAAALAATHAAPFGPRERSIAVLPFANVSGDPGNEYFSDGMSEEIINALTRLPHLRVAARTSCFAFKARNVDLREVGERLNVSTVLEGSVRKVGSRIRILAQLNDVAGGHHLWSERYDRELTDIFAIQDEIATAIADKLTVALHVGEELVRAPTDNLQAYDLFLKGRTLVRQRGPGLLRATECFERAIYLDTGFAPAYAELAEALSLVALYGMGHPAALGDRAAAATARAIALNPKLVAAQVTLGLVSLMRDFDREGACAAWARALELDPANQEARTARALFELCYIRGQHGRAIEELRAIAEGDPLNARLRAQLSIALAFDGQAAAAEAEARRGIELDPTAFYPNWTLLHALGLGPEPIQGADLGPALLGQFGRHPWIIMGLAWANGAAKRRDKADALYSELAARARSEYVQPATLAVAALGARRHADAVRHLGEARDIRDPLLSLMILHWPGFSQELRSDPAFVAILGSLGWL